MPAALLGFTLTRRYVRSPQGTSPFCKRGNEGIFDGDHARAVISCRESEKPPGHHFVGHGKVMSKSTIASSLPLIGCGTRTLVSFLASGRARVYSPDFNYGEFATIVR